MEHRIRNALWGMFIGDALAMPAHWIYRLANIEDVFDGGVTGYVDAPHPHPEAFMVGMAYRPDIDTAMQLGRPYDILHEHARFYKTPYSDLAIERTERESEHGNVVAAKEERYHYHHGLKAGENTLGAHLARVLLRSVASEGRYDPEAFVSAFVEHLTTPGRNRDPYTEVYIRRWFENFTHGLPPHACAEHQRNVWSINSHGGMIRPLIVSLLAKTPFQGLGLALEHQNLTHRSEILASSIGIAVPLLHELAGGAPRAETVRRRAAQVRVPKITGEDLFRTYRDHKGPGNIPPDEMWRLHADLVDEPYEVEGLRDAVLTKFATACYTEHGLPLLLHFAHDHDAEAALLANANAGGDNVHRGMVLGLLAGAATDKLPAHLVADLADHDEIAQEIDAFVDVALTGAV